MQMTKRKKKKKRQAHSTHILRWESSNKGIETSKQSNPLPFKPKPTRWDKVFEIIEDHAQRDFEIGLMTVERPSRALSPDMA